jgi:hypothetical protein
VCVCVAVRISNLQNPHTLGWPEPYIYTIYDRTFGDFLVKITVHTPYILHIHMVLANPTHTPPMTLHVCECTGALGSKSHIRCIYAYLCGSVQPKPHTMSRLCARIGCLLNKEPALYSMLALQGCFTRLLYKVA